MFKNCTVFKQLTMHILCNNMYIAYGPLCYVRDSYTYVVVNFRRGVPQKLYDTIKEEKQCQSMELFP